MLFVSGIRNGEAALALDSSRPPMNSYSCVRNSGRVFSACALVATLVSPVVQAQTAPDEEIILDPVVVTATRTPVRASQLGSAVTVITSEDLERRQITTLGEALGGAAGTPIQSGAGGGATSLFLRGSNSTQTLFLVDGIRASDPNSLYNNLLGGGGVLSTDRIEVVRGPQSTMYGADAIGGAVSISSERGRGEPSATVFAEAGSFDTARATVSAQGEKGANAYNVSITGFTTQNDRVNNDFEAITAAARVDHRVSDAVNLGATLRVFRSELGSPGATVGFGANNTVASENEENSLATVFAEFASGDWSGRATLGGQNRVYISEDPTPPFPAKTEMTTRRGVLDAQASYAGWETHRLTVGGTGEWMHFTSDGFGSPSARTLDYALFAQDEWNPVERVFFTAGVRRDEFEAFGGQTTGRVTGAWQALPETLKLRASYGTGFRAPSFLELFGEVPTLYRGNPNLEPEKSKGWDVGLDYTLPGDRGVLSATYFENDYENLISGFEFVGGPEPFTALNVGKARSRGVELAAKVRVTASLHVDATYTYTDAEDLAANQRLLRRPRHAATLDVWNDFGRGFSAGVGATFSADSIDIDAASPTGARTDGEDYIVTRVYAAWAVNDRLTLKVRVENLLDEEYAVVNGFPALGIGAYAGAEWRF
jgi:vitamin B12 transporter